MLISNSNFEGRNESEFILKIEIRWSLMWMFIFDVDPDLAIFESVSGTKCR